MANQKKNNNSPTRAEIKLVKHSSMIKDALISFASGLAACSVCTALYVSNGFSHDESFISIKVLMALLSVSLIAFLSIGAAGLPFLTLVLICIHLFHEKIQKNLTVLCTLATLLLVIICSSIFVIYKSTLAIAAAIAIVPTFIVFYLRRRHSENSLTGDDV